MASVTRNTPNPFNSLARAVGVVRANRNKTMSNFTPDVTARIVEHEDESTAPGAVIAAVNAGARLCPDCHHPYRKHNIGGCYCEVQNGDAVDPCDCLREWDDLVRADDITAAETRGYERALNTELAHIMGRGAAKERERVMGDLDAMTIGVYIESLECFVEHPIGGCIGKSTATEIAALLRRLIAKGGE